MKKINMVGFKSGRLTVVSESSRKNNFYTVFWNCKCDCGKDVVTSTNYLKAGRSKSCGCLKNEKLTTHGLTRNRIYRIWTNIKTRCTNEKYPLYRDYGGRGITVCEEWKNFDNFFKDMGLPPTTKHEIDRIDNNKGYSKENCRWVDRSLNMHNRNSFKNSTSQYKGVSFNKDTMKWRAQITKDRKIYYLGLYKTEIEAAKAYDLKAIELRGENASLNFK